MRWRQPPRVIREPDYVLRWAAVSVGVVVLFWLAAGLSDEPGTWYWQLVDVAASFNIVGFGVLTGFFVRDYRTQCARRPYRD